MYGDMRLKLMCKSIARMKADKGKSYSRLILACSSGRSGMMGRCENKKAYFFQIL